MNKNYFNNRNTRVKDVPANDILTINTILSLLLLLDCMNNFNNRNTRVKDVVDNDR